MGKEQIYLDRSDRHSHFGQSEEIVVRFAGSIRSTILFHSTLPPDAFIANAKFQLKRLFLLILYFKLPQSDGLMKFSSIFQPNLSHH